MMMLPHLIRARQQLDQILADLSAVEALGVCELALHIEQSLPLTPGSAQVRLIMLIAAIELGEITGRRIEGGAE